MTAILHRVLPNHPARAAAAQPAPIVTAHPLQPDVVVLAVRGEVDTCTGRPLRDRLLEHVRSGGPHLVIDLTAVTFLGAAGLTVLVTVRDAALAAGLRVCLVARARPVLLPMSITGLDAVFDILPDIGLALMRMGSGPDG
ncbi:STAS domain-containing protein [Lentzea tibetensis]|uniref:Anti-sigma factor antagonist n=1 Tax=Lentzea tibetensis TaxID=2591470 RepID=A0A563EKT6_9PSEU|nr:STAS domain-containing protein [Lentzea tibetensis]TWP47554.1 STAS domain-containing protein [Lentzea tibetensis]